MQTETTTGIEFAPNRSKRNLLIIYITCGFFAALGLLLLVTGIAESQYWHNPDDKVGTGAALFGGGVLFLLIAHFLTSPMNVHYFVGKEGVTLKAFKTTRQLSYAEIESITALEEGQSEKFILQLQNQTAQKQQESITGAARSKEEGDLSNMWERTKDAFKEQKRAFEKFKFLSVATVYSSSGRQRGVRKAQKADLPCATVLILMKNGESFFISPLDIEGFVREAKKHMR